MNDIERLEKLKAALEIAQLADVNVELTTDELGWLIRKVEVCLNSIGHIVDGGKGKPFIPDDWDEL